MKAQEKVMITSITSAVEVVLHPALAQSGKVIKTIERSAKKLAHKLLKDSKSDKKHPQKAH